VAACRDITTTRLKKRVRQSNVWLLADDGVDVAGGVMRYFGMTSRTFWRGECAGDENIVRRVV